MAITRNTRALTAAAMQRDGFDCKALAAHFGVTKNEVRNLLGRARRLTQTPAERDAAASVAFGFFGALQKCNRR